MEGRHDEEMEGLMMLPETGKVVGQLQDLQLQMKTLQDPMTAMLV